MSGMRRNEAARHRTIPARRPGRRTASLLSALALAALGGTAGCSDDSSPTGNGPDLTRYRITVGGAGYASVGGRDMVVAVARAASGTVVATDSTPIATNGTFRLAFLPILERNTAYHVDLFVDANGNGLCDAPPDDLAWRIPFQSGEADTTLALDFTDEYDGSACASF
jgi:hypothetical protein